MRELGVDFAKPSLVVRTLIRIAIVLVALAAIGQGYLSWRAWAALQSERLTTAEMQSQLELKLTQSRDGTSPSADSPYQRDVQTLMSMASFDMGGALRSVEAVQLDGVKVTGIDADAVSRVVKIELELGSGELISTFIEYINAGNELPRWRLTRLQTQVSLTRAELVGEF